MDRKHLTTSPLRGDLAALLCVFIWGINFVLVKAAYQQFNVYAFTSLRYAAMLVLGWTVVALRGGAGADLKLMRSQDRGRIALVGCLGFTLYIPLSMLGLNYTTAFANALLIALGPLFMALLLWLGGTERIGRGHLLGLGVAVAGVVIFVSGSGARGPSPGVGFGDLLSLLAAFFYAAYNVANKRLALRYQATTVTAVTLTIGALPVLVACLPGLLAQDWHRVNAAGWITLAFSSVFPVYLAWTVWSWANARVGVARTSVFMYLVPLFGGIASWLVLRESFTVPKLAGAAVIISGLVVARTLAGRRQAVSRAPNPDAAQPPAEPAPQPHSARAR